MKVTIVTARFREPRDVLAQCIQSVAGQTHPCRHIIVEDGGDPVPADLASGVEIIRLPNPHQDWGSTARAVGSVIAIADDCDALAWLDADNFYQPDHITSLVDLHHSTGAPVCSSSRMLCKMDGNVLGPCVEVHPDRFIDTNCYLITREAFLLVQLWYLLPRRLGYYADRHFFTNVKQSGFQHAHSGLRTVYYRTNWANHYLLFGQEPPPGAPMYIPNPSRV